MFERETHAGERQVMVLPAQVVLMYLGCRSVPEGRAPAPCVREGSAAVAGEPFAFIAGVWFGVAMFAAGALWLALR